MDSRIGYPNEHLATSNEDITSPMFATSVGLIMKGLETLDKKNRKNNNVIIPETIKEHSKTGTSSFIDKLKSFFDEN